MEAEAYQALFDANPLPMFVADRATTQIILVNQAACLHYGWSQDEFLALTLRDMRPESELPQFEAAFADTSKKEQRVYSRLARHRTKDGRVIDVSMQISPLTIGGRDASLAVVTNVTGIAEAERRFRLLVEHSNDGIALLDRNYVTQYVSPGGQRILGYEPGELSGTTGERRVHPDDAARWVHPKPGETQNHIARILHRDGSWRWIESSTTNLTHEPAVGAYVTNYRDITARKIAEQRYEFLLSATAAITYTARSYGDYGATFVSANVERVLGHKPEDFTSRGDFWLTNIHPDDRQLVELELARLFEHAPVTLEYRFRHADGSYRWMRDVARVLGDEVAGYWIDVTDEVRAETAMRRSEANFRALIERAPVATFVHRGGRYVYVNPAAVALLGYPSADEIVGRPAEITAGRVRRADGSIVTIEGERVRLDFDGAPSDVVMGRDVTERNDMFARLALADRMLSIGTLAAGVAHEINNPLAYVSANLEALSNELPNLKAAPASRLDDRALASLVTDARDGVSRMTAIVRDLRSLSRPDDEERGPVDVVQVLSAAIKMAHNEIRHRARVSTSYDNDLPAITGDSTRLGQVFLNLLINAAQAITEGNAAHNEIRVRAGVERGRLRVDITDTGVGIAAPVLRRIFDPFFTTKAPGAGMGLGLSISHHIVKAMGGEIVVASEPGSGSTFSVMLPAAGSVVASGTSPIPIVRRSIGRILLIDDEAAVGRSLARLLAPDTEVIAVTRAEDALRQIEAGERFDAILCDVMMPEITGIELYERLVRTAPSYQSRIIFMTGGAFTEQAREFLAKCGRPSLEKPFSEAQLRRAIESVLGS